jgi:hypothetical protein
MLLLYAEFSALRWGQTYFAQLVLEGLTLKLYFTEEQGITGCFSAVDNIWALVAMRMTHLKQIWPYKSRILLPLKRK